MHLAHDPGLRKGGPIAMSRLLKDPSSPLIVPVKAPSPWEMAVDCVVQFLRDTLAGLAPDAMVSAGDCAPLRGSAPGALLGVLLKRIQDNTTITD
jgi:hypothetical protein